MPVADSPHVRFLEQYRTINGALFTPEGRINITASRFAAADGPLDPNCDCDTCATFSAASSKPERE